MSVSQPGDMRPAGRPKADGKLTGGGGRKQKATNVQNKTGSKLNHEEKTE